MDFTPLIIAKLLVQNSRLLQKHLHHFKNIYIAIFGRKNFYKFI